MARVVRADAGDDGGALGALAHGQLDQREVLVVVQRGGLPRRPGDDEAVGPVCGEVVHQGDERVVVDAQIRVEGRDDRRQDASQLHDLRVSDARVRRPPHTAASPCPCRTRIPASVQTRCAQRARRGRRRRWQAPEGGFAVVSALTDEGEEVTLTGTLDHVHEGELLEAGGTWSRHAKHGWRFQVSAVRSLGPSSDAALLNLLSSVRHVGPSGAAWLLKTHGPDVLEIVDRDPRSALRAVPGVGPSRIGPACAPGSSCAGGARCACSWRSAASRRRRHPGSSARSARRPSDCCARTPYSATEVDGVGFATADSLARALGTDQGAPERLDAGVLCTPLPRRNATATACCPSGAGAPRGDAARPRRGGPHRGTGRTRAPRGRR